MTQLLMVIMLSCQGAKRITIAENDAQGACQKALINCMLVDGSGPGKDASDLEHALARCILKER